MSTGVGCTLWVDGVKVADGSPDDRPAAVAALSGLQVTFGRDTTLDQPQPSSCTFQILDEPGGDRFVDLLQTGRAVEVRAAGTIYVDPDTSTITDPTFDTTPVGQTPPNVTSTTGVATVALLDGDPALRVDPRDASQLQQVTVAPAAFSAVPADWDTIPKLVAGQEWGVSVDVRAFAGAEVTLQPVGYPDPTGQGAITVGPPTRVVATGGLDTITARVSTAVVSDVWIGVRVTVYPSGPAWDAAPVIAWDAATGTWNDAAAFYLDNVQVTAPAGGVTREVLVFSGRVTDIQASWDAGKGGAVADVTAADFTADMDNVRIGDEPWTAEPMGDRFDRIITLSGLGIPAVIDDALRLPVVSWQDVDSQPVTGLLQDLAQSVDGVMWSAVHSTTGPYIYVEDPASRPALYTLAVDPDSGLVVIVAATDVPDGLALSACDVLRDPVQWVQNVSDVSTRVNVGWLEQGVDDDGQPTTTDRSVVLIDADLEVNHGQRSVSVSTLLTTEADAGRIADAILERASVTGWRIGGATVDDYAMESTGPDAVNLMLQLLDGTIRNGLPVTLTDLPPWSPVGEAVPGYVEGGSYTFADGYWTLAVTLSRATTKGVSVAWAELPNDPAWAWANFDPEITWADLFGVAAPEGVLV